MLDVTFGTARNILLRCEQTDNSYASFNVRARFRNAVRNELAGFKGGLVGYDYDENAGAVNLDIVLENGVYSITPGIEAEKSVSSKYGVINSARTNNTRVTVLKGGIFSLDDGPAISVGFQSQAGQQTVWVDSPIIHSEGIPLDVTRGSLLVVRNARITSSSDTKPVATGKAHNGNNPGKPAVVFWGCESNLAPADFSFGAGGTGTYGDPLASWSEPAIDANGPDYIDERTNYRFKF